MLLSFSHALGRLLRLLPKRTSVRLESLQASFFVPPNCHYVADDLNQIASGQREPRLYQWLAAMPEGSVYFDVGTSYGQEVALASSPLGRNVTVVGFDCGLYHAHFCALNRRLNEDRFEFVFAAVGETSGELVTITCNSDTHIPHLHRKNVPYSYDVMTLALDDYVKRQQLSPTHLKIDVDGAEFGVLRGAAELLADSQLREVFIEIDHENAGIMDYMADLGFTVAWSEEKAVNRDVLFVRSG